MTRLISPKTAAGKRARSKAANKRAILDAGRRVFATIGFEAATVRDIIRETDLASGTFYNYFKSKEDVFEAIAADSSIEFRALLKDVRARTHTLEDYIREAYTAYFTFLEAEHRRLPSLYTDGQCSQNTTQTSFATIRVDTPEMKATADEIRRDLERILSGDDAPDIDVAYLTAACIGIARDLGEVMLARKPIDVESASAFASDFALSAIGRMTPRQS